MFLFQLALRLGRTVGELQASLSVDELKYWYAFNQIEPIGLHREDALFGALAANIAKCFPTQEDKEFLIGDFMLFHNLKDTDDESDFEYSVQESVENVMAFFAARKV